MPNFTLGDEVFEAAASRFPTPFHLYDEAGIRERARRLKEAFGWCRDFREYFAVKALPNPAVLRILREEGFGADCSSATELTLAEVCGFSGEEIMFSANAMPPSEFDQARGLGAIVNLDDASDVDLLAAHGGIPELVCLRYNPGGDFMLGNAIMGNPGEAKYGMPEDQLEFALLRLKGMGAKRFGLHAFLSSNTMDAAYYPELPAEIEIRNIIFFRRLRKDNKRLSETYFRQVIYLLNVIIVCIFRFFSVAAAKAEKHNDRHNKAQQFFHSIILLEITVSSRPQLCCDRAAKNLFFHGCRRAGAPQRHFLRAHEKQRQRQIIFS